MSTCSINTGLYQILDKCSFELSDRRSWVQEVHQRSFWTVWQYCEARSSIFNFVYMSDFLWIFPGMCKRPSGKFHQIWEWEHCSSNAIPRTAEWKHMLVTTLLNIQKWWSFAKHINNITFRIIDNRTDIHPDDRLDDLSDISFRMDELIEFLQTGYSQYNVETASTGCRMWNDKIENWDDSSCSVNINTYINIRKCSLWVVHTCTYMYVFVWGGGIFRHMPFKICFTIQFFVRAPPLIMVHTWF